MESNPKYPRNGNEFIHEGLSDWDPRLDRREFLKMSAAALAMAGFSGCIKQPLEIMHAYVSQPEDLVLGQPTFFATHYALGGMTNGLLVETHEGRPTRVDGNPGHPANLGAASAIHQALVLSLYDPDRIKNGSDSALKVHARIKSVHSKNKGAGLAILSEGISSDAMRAEQSALQKLYPGMTWVEYDALQNGASTRASMRVWGNHLRSVYHLKNADQLVSIDADFLSHPHFPLVYAKDFANHPSLKLFSIETSASLSGQKSVKRLALKPTRLIRFVEKLAGHLLNPHEKTNFTDREKAFVNDIGNASTKTLFIPGDHLPESIHAACFLLNERFAKNAVQLVEAPKPPAFCGTLGLETLTTLMSASKIETLIILGGNPAYSSPLHLGFAEKLKYVPFSAHLATHANETSARMNEVISQAHELETWSDGRAFDGTLSFAQPMIAPMHGGLSQIEFLKFLRDGVLTSGHEILTQFYQNAWGSSFHQKWRTALAQGFLLNSAWAETKLKSKLRISQIHFSVVPQDSPIEKAEVSFEVAFREDRKIYDGRFANHPWLQEFPDPLTRLTWGNAILAHPSDLKSRSLVEGDIVRLEALSQSIEGPVYADPLQARGSLTLNFGYGRTHAGFQGSGVGFDVYPLWRGTSSLQNVSLQKTARREEFASTQSHHSMEGRDLIKRVGRDESAKANTELASLYPKDPIPDLKEAWAMTIDLDRCTGCGACVVACQSENNIPTVGKEAVRMGREMHWIRVDRYFENNQGDDSESPVAEFQPVPCMHCEKAPCEPVCPTGATVHGSGGLNQMVYNRCVGTRYCSNNCPYKVRRFNFLTYNQKNDKLSAQQKNPNVSVRTRGVMEKCTYCTQRISAARILAAREKRSIRDQEVKTACQVTCPSQAIQFGNLKDVSSEVLALKKSPRNYGLLEELGTKPRTTYLAKVKREDT